MRKRNTKAATRFASMSDADLKWMIREDRQDAERLAPLVVTLSNNKNYTETFVLLTTLYATMLSLAQAEAEAGRRNIAVPPWRNCTQTMDDYQSLAPIKRRPTLHIS